MNRRSAVRALYGGLAAAFVLWSVRSLGSRVAFVVGAAVILVGCAATTIAVSWSEGRREPTDSSEDVR
ncbi:hypothetical protein [Cellulomonas alba]|uniref:Uncharacterized protein n=1 Tax=Cellulomonas alba TaxID=3053467 RepID=A0ABT7SHP5_9CELL|nr:hypothetical protein [Cellulomonas alba]MDM7855713.1 hypothetical protein [Cellulomonas alba]